MGMTIAIDRSYINKMPKSCKECPLTYLDTGDDAYFGANERRCVIDDSCVDGMVSERAYDCPLVEAIPRADYENRLKADMEAMLEEIDLQFDEICFYKKGEWKTVPEIKAEYKAVIQQKINALRGTDNE